MRNKEFPSVCRYSYDECKRNNALAWWSESAEENRKCADFVKTKLAQKYDGSRICVDVAEQCIKEFGYNRLEYVLATTLNHLNNDGRISAVNKAWAKSIINRSDEQSEEYRINEHPTIIDALVNQYKKEYTKLQLFDVGQIDTDVTDYEGKVVVRANELSEKYLTPFDQLHVATGGFGCDGNNSGRAVFTICINDGEKIRWEREQIIGVLKDEFLPDWAVEKLEEYQLDNGQTMEME